MIRRKSGSGIREWHRAWIQVAYRAGVLGWLGNVSYRRNVEPLRDMIKRLQGPEQTVSFLERLATSQDLTFPSGE